MSNLSSVSKIHIRPNTPEFDECQEFCQINAEFYNSCMRYVLESYKANHDSFYYTDESGKRQAFYKQAHLYHKFKDSLEFMTTRHPEYDGRRYMNTKILKQTQMRVERAFNGFDAALRSYWKDRTNFTGEPRCPKGNKRNVVTTVPRDAYSVSKCGRYITISKSSMCIDVKHLVGCKLREIQIVPSTYGYTICINYISPTTERKETKKPTNPKSRLAGLDIGLNNLAALGFNVSDVSPFFVSGKQLKSVNQFYNKLLAKYKSELPKGVYSSKKIRRMTQKRNNKIEYLLHKASRYIIDHLVFHGIECLVIGRNKGWKQKINTGKKNNQRFVQIPFYKFIQMITYKAARVGIHVISREEAYTSKCSFVDMEDVKKHTTYVGTRVKRGLFQTASGILLNADLNGALNILRKEFGNNYFVDQVNLTKLFANSKIVR